MTGVNDNPATDPITASTAEDSTATVDLVAAGNSTDPDASDVLTVTAIGTTGTIGQVTLTGGVARYVPGAGWAHLAAGQTGTDTFTYTVSDGKGGIATNTVTVTVVGVAGKPVLAPDTAATTETAAVTSNVLANDSHPDAGATMTVTDATIDAGSAGTGTVTFTGTSVTFTPTLNAMAAGQTRTVTITYTLTDGNGATASETLTVTVTGENDSPTTGPVAYTTSEDGVLTLSALLTDAGAGDPDTADTLTVSAIDTTGTLGQATLSGGVVTYTPGPAWQSLAAGQSGTDTFTYTVSDGHGGTATATVTITVTGISDAPTPVADVASTTETAAVTTDVLANDTHPDTGATMTVTDATLDSGSADTGAVTITDTSVTYTPTLDALSVGQTRTVTITYTVTDGNGQSATSTLTVTVLGENDSPATGPVVDTTDEDTAIVFDDLGVIGGATDPDTADSLSVSAVDTTGTIGQVVLSGGVVTYTPGAGWQHLVIGQTKTDTFTYTVSDGHGGTATATVTVAIDGVNDSPAPVDDTASTSETTEVTTAVLANETHPDAGGILTLLDATLADGADGTTSIDSATGSISFTPNLAWLSAGQTRDVVITYTVVDQRGATATATLTVTVTGTNTAPTATDYAASTDEDLAYVISDWSTIATDPDTADVLGASAVDTTGTIGQVTISGGALTYTPGPGWQRLLAGETGTDTFVVTISDGHGGTATSVVTMTIRGVGDGPTAVADTASTNENTAVTTRVTANDFHPEGGTVEFVSATMDDPAQGSVTSTPAGDVTYTPTMDYLGAGESATVVITYVIQDADGDQASSTLTITVTGVNDAPTAKAWTYSTDEETKLAISDLLSHAADLDTTDTVSISAVNTSGIQGTATWSGGVLTYTPAAAYQALPVGSSATETFTVTYVDTHGATVTQTMTIVVHGVNDPAWAEADQTATDEDTPVTTDVIANDGDIDNPAGLFVASAALEFPADGTLSISGGKITYTPSVDAMLPGQTRLIVVYYVLEDNGGYQVESTLTIEVTGLNDTPTALDPSLTTTESAPLAIGGPFVVAADPDAGEVLTLSGVTTVAAQGTLTLAGNELAYTPAAALETLRAGQTVTERFTVVVTDSRGATTTVPVTVTVVGENDPVIANPDTASTDEDTAVTTDVVANDTDLDTGDTKTITSATMSDPADGSVTVNGASLVFTPTLDRLAQGATHDVVITYVVVDSAGAESTSTLTITVTGINDAPVGADPVRVEVTGLDPVTIPQDLLNTADPEGGPVTVTGVETEPQHGTVTIVDGLPVYTPDPDLSSLGEGETVTDTFVIAVVDEFGTPGFLTIVVTITGVNDAPDAVDDSATAADNAATATVDVLANDTDPDTKDVLSITQASANQGAVKIVDGKLAHSFTPEEFLALPVGTPVTVTMTYSIDDGHGLTDTATVTLTYLRTIANDTDSDGNGIPDWWEVAFHGGSPGSSTLPVPGAVCRDPNDLLDLLSGTLKPGATVTVEGSRAWLPGSAVGYYVCSTPTLLDKVNATSDGRATATLTMPSTFDAGKHVLFGIGISSSGETLIQAIGFEVPPAPTVDGDDNGSGDDGGKGDDSSSGNHSGSGNDPDALPLTGVAFLPQIVLLAVMLIFVGFVTVGAANRRRQ